MSKCSGVISWMTKKIRGLATNQKRIIASVMALIMLFSGVPFTSIVNADAPVLYGDVNGDNAVNSSDVLVLKKFLAEYNIDIDLTASDVNVDGVVDLRDLLLLEQYVDGQDVILGEVVTVTFHTNGGTEVKPIKLCKGATLASVIESMPKTTKQGFIFTGWYKSDKEAFYSEDIIEESVDIYASYIEMSAKEALSVSSFSLTDQKSDLSFTIVSSSPMSVGEVQNALTLLSMDGSEPIALEVIMDSDTQFIVKAKNGFVEGASYQLILAEGVSFKDKENSIRTANFTIYKKEVNNVTFKEGIVYIKDTDSMSYYLQGSEIAVPVLEVAMLSSETSDAVEGYFYFTSGNIAVGEILCIYETVHPADRDYVTNDYKDDSMAYIEITSISGTKISFKSISETDSDKIIFIPDTIPFSVLSLPTAPNGKINTIGYDSIVWKQMGYEGTPEFNVGDFLVFYCGAFADLNDDTPVYFGEITAINGNEITYIQTTAEAIEASQDLFLQNPVDGEELLENVDIEGMQRQIEMQALNSGFAKEAALYLFSTAQATDGFKNMSLQSMSMTTADGKAFSAARLKSIGGSWELGDNVKVNATIGKSSKYFKDGVKLSLRIEAEFSVDLGEDGEMKILLSASFIEEIAVDVNVNAKAKVKWILFIPIFKSLSFGASVDIKNYSAISVDVKVYTVQKEEESFWQKLKGYNSTFKDILEKAEELQEKIDTAKETADKIKGYKEDLELLWSSLKQQTNGELTEDSYKNLLSTLGELNITNEMMELLNLTTEDDIEAGVQDLMERYSKMLETESEWITLVEKEIFSKDAYIYIFAIGIDVDFVIKANVNIALGANLEYVVGKRYSFWFDIIKKTSGSSTMDLLDERFAFQFYVMGAIGLKMGIKAELKAGIISTKIGSIGVSTEFGPYIKLWGYFIYEYSKLRPANTNTWNYDERMMGALYLEFGLYLEVAFNAEVLGGLISYNPTLFDKEFPLLTAGNRINYYDFGYELEDDESVIVEDTDKNSNNGISMVLPETYRSMSYIDLVEGNLGKEVTDYSRFAVTLSNRNFQLDKKTGVITVTVPQNVQYMECDLTLTWTMGKMEFSSRDISVTIPLVWTTLSTSELNQKYTASVKVGNPQDGYTTVWSSRVKKNASFNLPTESEILKLLSYDNYNNGSDNLKYQSVAGYGSQKTDDLTIYVDTTYYFDVELREYTLTINDVQDKTGKQSIKTFTAKYGEHFDLSELFNSGASDSQKGSFTSYLNTIASLNGSTTIDGKEINRDITRVIDNQFARQILSGVQFNAKYTDNSVEATFSFVGDGINIPDKTVKIQKGTIPPDVFSEEISGKNIIITGISPVLGSINANTFFTINCIYSVEPSFVVTYHTNGGTAISAKEVQRGAMLIPPIAPTKTGYTFVVWYTDAALKNAFDFNNAIMPGYDFDLYAKWSGNEYILTFDTNEGSLPEGTKNPISVTYGNNYPTLPIPTRPAYKFLGWFTQRNGGTKISESSIVDILNETTVFAQWQEKQIINTNIITYNQGQTNVYNRQSQPFVLSSGVIPVKSFEIYYKRQGLDSEYTTQAINAGTYDIKLVRQEDNDYKYFETVLSGVYTITKADSSILSLPSGTAYYGNINADKMINDVDYIGDGQLQYAASVYNTTTYEQQYVVDLGPPVIIGKRQVPRVVEWKNSQVLYNLYDKSDVGNSLYLWVKLAEGENYKASEIKVSAAPIQITNKPKSIINGLSGLTYKVNIKTSDIGYAGTDSNIYVALGNSSLQHLDDSTNNFERNDLDTFQININPNSLYNDCFGTIPLKLHYEKKGTSSGWHCEWISVDVYKNGNRIITGNRQNVNRWFEDGDITEVYKLTGYERVISNWGMFVNETNNLNLTQGQNDYIWVWSTASNLTPTITDQYSGNAYNPYAYLNAPELSVFFDNGKYDKFIDKNMAAFSLDRSGLYEAMIEDGVRTLKLNVNLEFFPVNGNHSVTAAAGKRYRAITITCEDVEEKAYTKRQTMKYLSQNIVNVVADVTTMSNGTFDVTYRLDNNAGIWGTKFAVNYDKSKLELQGYTLGDVFSESEVVAPERFDNGRFVFFASRSDFTNSTTSGTLVTLSFKIKSGASLTDYPVTLDDTAMQSISVDGNVVSQPVTHNSAKITVEGSTDTIKAADKVTINADAGSSTIVKVEVKKDDAAYTDITESYGNGYTVTKNGSYTFKITTASGETATSSIVYSKLDTTKPVVEINANGYNGTWTKNVVTLSVANKTENLGNTTFSYKVGNGEWMPYTAPIMAQDINGAVTYSFKAISQSGIESDVASIAVKKDFVAPEGDLLVGSNSIKKALNSITFGLFFKETKTVTISGTDADSGVDKTLYYLADKELTTSEIEAITEWKEANGSFDISPNNKYVIYVKLTDKVGNSAVICSDGVVLDNKVPTIGGIEDGKTYCKNVVISISDDNLDKITLNNEEITLQDGKFTVNPADTKQTLTVTDKAGNSKTVEFTVNHDHTWDEGKVTKAASTSEYGEKLYTCLVCGETKTEQIAKLPPTIILGVNSEWQQGATGGIIFRSNASIADFVSVTIDGAIVDEDEYELAEGSTVVTLKAEYLASLAVGKHTISINSVSGSATADFTIKAAVVENPDGPKTSQYTFLWIIPLLVSTVLTYYVSTKKKQRVRVKYR